MNTMTHAMKEAGFRPLPLNRRIWNWLKDHPEKTYDEIAVAIGGTMPDVSSTLSEMYRRGMLNVYQCPSLKKGLGKTPPMVRRYSVKFAEFELLPLPPKRKEVKIRKLAAVPARPVDPAPAEGTVRKPLGELLREKLGGKNPVGRPRIGAEVHERGAYINIGIAPEIISVLDQCIVEMEDETSITLSRAQFIQMLIKRYIKGKS